MNRKIKRIEALFIRMMFFLLLFLPQTAMAKDIDKSLLVQIAGIFVVIGHTFPIFFKFKGGKGVATSLGVLLMTNWKIGLICLVFALILMVLTKMVSMGSVGAAILFPVLVMFINANYTISEGSSYFVYSIIHPTIHLGEL